LLIAGSVRAQAQQSATSFHNQPVYDFRPGNPDIDSGPAYAVGTMAPDFAVPEIQSLLHAAEQSIHKVRLSAYRGKQPLVLICSSYT
jgi:hypothetical protein